MSPPGVSSCREGDRKGISFGMTVRAGRPYVRAQGRTYLGAERRWREPYAAVRRAWPGARGRRRPLASGSRCGRNAVRFSRSRMAVRTRVRGTGAAQRALMTEQATSAVPSGRGGGERHGGGEAAALGEQDLGEEEEQDPGGPQDPGEATTHALPGAHVHGSSPSVLLWQPVLLRPLSRRCRANALPRRAMRVRTPLQPLTVIHDRLSGTALPRARSRPRSRPARAPRRPAVRRARADRRRSPPARRPGWRRAR